MKSLKLVSVFVIALLFTHIASAQDAQPLSDESTGAREPAAAPQAAKGAQTPQSPSAARTRRMNSEDDERILEHGPIPQGRYISGGVVGSIFGFGIGHAIQGTYAKRGWIFTVGELAALTVMVASVKNCRTEYDSYGYKTDRCDSNAGAVVVGLVGLIGFHVWEVVDLWVTPPRINRRYDELTDGDRRHRVTMQMAPIMVSATTPGLGLNITF